MTASLPIASWVQLARPWWLIAAAGAVVPLALALLARSRGRRLRMASVVLQCLAILAAAAALAGPSAPLGPRAHLPYLYLQDASASTRLQKPGSWPANLPREVFNFAATVTPAGQDVTDPNRTRLAAALNLASARANKLAGLVIRTDGRFTDADWPAAAGSLGAAGIDVLVIAMDSPPPDARVADFSARRTARRQVDLRVTVTANAHQRRTVRIFRDASPETPLLERNLELLAGDSATIRVTDDDAPPGAPVYRAELSPADEFAENDSAAAIAPSPVRTVALIDPQQSLRPAELAAEAATSVRNIAPPRAPRTAAGWMEYSAVVLVDDNGSLLERTQRSALAEYVRAGGGLVLLGAGPHATPADRGDPLNLVAALLSNPYERTPLAVTVVLDASGSMTEPAAIEAGAGRIKFDLARRAVLSLRRHLTVRDALSVITFSDAPRLIFDSGDGTIDFASLSRALNGVQPGGATKVLPALELAAADRRADERKKLVIVVSDLATERFDPQSVAGDLAGRGISLAIVAPSAAADTDRGDAPLERLAGLLDAPLVRCERLTDLAAVFAGFLRSARVEALVRGRFVVEADPPPFGVDFARLGPLEAYILSGAQRGTEVLATVASDPLLGRRRVGLGRSVTLAVPLGEGLNSGPRQSPALADLLAAAVRWTLRPESDPRFAGQLEREGDALVVRVEATDAAGPMNLLQLALEIVSPARADAAPRRDSMMQVAPGRYEASVRTGAGPLSVQVREQPAGRIVWRADAPRTHPREFAALGADWDNLRRLAKLSGGRIVSAADVPTAVRRLRAGGYRPLWGYLLAAALICMLAEWALTRVVRRGNA